MQISAQWILLLVIVKISYRSLFRMDFFQPLQYTHALQLQFNYLIFIRLFLKDPAMRLTLWPVPWTRIICDVAIFFSIQRYYFVSRWQWMLIHVYRDNRLKTPSDVVLDMQSSGMMDYKLLSNKGWKKLFSSLMPQSKITKPTTRLRLNHLYPYYHPLQLRPCRHMNPLN